MKYHWIARPEWGSFGWTFDRTEIFFFDFHFSLCLKHRYFDFHLALLGFFVDASVYEPAERNTDGPDQTVDDARG